MVAFVSVCATVAVPYLAAQASPDVSNDQLRLELVWDGVTAGAVTLPPWGVGVGEDSRIVIATEDRHVRVVDPTGAEVARTRTGVRRPQAVLDEGSDRFLMVPEAATGRPMVRLHWTGRTLRTVGSLVPTDVLLSEESQDLYLDGGGLVYGVSPRGMVGHGSTVSGLLWDRRLPAQPRAGAVLNGSLHVATRDQRLFRFDTTGTGREVLRTDVVVAAMGGSDGRLVLIDEEGNLSLVTTPSAPEAPRDYRLEWTVAVGEPDETIRFDPMVVMGSDGVEPMILAPSRDGGVTAVDTAGRILWRVRFPGNPIESLADGSGTMLVFLLDSEERLVAVDRGGAIRTVLQIDGEPTHLSWVAGAGQLVVTYPDWRIESFGLATPSGVDPLRGSGISRPAAPPATTPEEQGGALRARADGVLAGNSRAERLALIETLASQRSRGALFGRVGEAQEILGEVMLEAFRAPTMGAGRVRNDFPAVRRAAAIELTAYMDRRSRALLSEAIRLDPYYPTVAAALEGFARYGVDDRSVLETANARFRTASAADRGILAPAMVSILEQTAVVELQPRVASETVSLLVQSNVSRELRARAARIGR
jgi:hypothetical protein